MGKLNRLHQIIGWLVFTIAALVYIFSAERTGSLWDVGEFILGAHKLQVVHPPGAPLFLLIGRLFAEVGDLVGGDNEAMIAYFVNMMSGFCTAFGAAFVAWSTMRLSKISLFGARNYEPQIGSGQNIAIAASGLVAGLGTAFCTSIWFSAVEGEVYAMSLFFTCMTLWAMVKWYALPDKPETDRWMLFALFSAGLSTGVHLLSILTIPAMAILYYYKRFEKTSLLGLVLSVIAGVGIIVFIQAFVIVGIPTMWLAFEIPMVNSFRLPVHSGIVPALALLLGTVYLGLSIAGDLARGNTDVNGRKYGLAFLLALISVLTMGWVGFIVAIILVIGSILLAQPKYAFAYQQLFVGLGLLVTAFSTIGVVVLRAEAKTPVNMNNPDNVTSLLPYLNREQYGERSLVYGQLFTAKASFGSSEERYGLVNGKYVEGLTEKVNIAYDKKMLFSRMYDNSQGRVGLYRQWMGIPQSQTGDPLDGLPAGRPSMVDNIKFFFRYQVGWMYWRYFMWNFSGRQNGEQGFYDWDESSGNWITGIKPLDEMRLGNLDEVPEWEADAPSNNKYYLLPFIFGLIGLFWHASKSPKEFIAILGLFVITGLGIIIYTNQPPNEPRERDYVLVGSFFTFCMWMGMAVPALYELIKEKLNVKGFAPAAGISALVLVAPLLMGFENWDDHSRAEHTAARDYASNFLNSVDPNAIIFTYGDNDTYPLWYAQEIEGIRKDVRVVNLSLIAVDWYINLLRYKMNDSDPLKLTLSEEKIAGNRRNQVPYIPRAGKQSRDCSSDRPISLEQFMAAIEADNPDPRYSGQFETQYNSCNVGINVDPVKLRAAPWLVPEGEQPRARIPVGVRASAIQKDELAILDIINNNFYERPIYWAVTCRPEKLLGFGPFLQLEGLALKLTATANRRDRRELGIIGEGGINTEKTADLILNTWRYGNFDKVKTHVNSSYAPAVQSMQLVAERTMFNLVDEGKVDKALEVGDKYFEAFPNFNFPYHYQTFKMLQPYLTTNNGSRAREVIEQLARNTVDRLDFLNSVDKTIVDRSPTYRRDEALALNIAQNLVTQVRRQNDPELTASVESIMQPYLFLADEREEQREIQRQQQLQRQQAQPAEEQ